jgi:hypothetical protein
MGRNGRSAVDPVLAGDDERQQQPMQESPTLQARPPKARAGWNQRDSEAYRRLTVKTLAYLKQAI